MRHLKIAFNAALNRLFEHGSHALPQILTSEILIHSAHPVPLCRRSQLAFTANHAPYGRNRSRLDADKSLEEPRH
jgi:hypothetical protein